ncbi:MAG: NACHT domain-containing protein [Rickettsiales bacterium]|nr:NACHT domain-containing protein [Rickettsiales bacterium]MDR1260870.1 NACHT domain-containing protein [Rickettsiales bacterium]
MTILKKEIERGCGRLTNKDKRDDILDIGGGKRYEFIFDKNKDIVERLKDASDLNRLAKELVKVIFGEKKSLNLKNELFKTYHVPLVKEVFDKKSDRAAGKTKWYCELKENFTKGNNLSKGAKLLQEAFKKEALKIDKSIDSDNLWSTVSKRKLDVSSTFGEHTKPTGGKLKRVSDEEVKQSLPNDPVIDDEIKEFFEKLIFTVEQPNEEELGKLIQDKIFNSLDHLKDYVQAEMIYNYVQKQMLDWLKKPKSTALLKKDDFFSEGAEKVKEIMLSIPDREYNSYIKEKGINFNNESEELQKLKGFLNSKDKKILNFVSSEKNIFLSQAKVCQVKKQVAWQLRALLSLKKFGDNKAGNLFKDNLLVIVCKNESQTECEDIKGLYNELADSIKDNEKKVVLITQSNSILASFFKEGCLKNNYEERLDKTGVRDLDPDYLQNKLLKKTIIFQGQERDLAHLVEIEDKKLNNNGLSEEEIHKLEKVVKCETLCELISDEDIVVGDKLPDFRDSSSPYYDPYHIDIPREFDYQIMSKGSLKNCVEKRKEDIFTFSAIGEDCLNNLVPQEEKGKIKAFSKGSSDEGFLDGRFFVLDAKNPEEDFKKLANNNSVKDVHWITSIDNKFILKHSSRLSDLREFIIKDSRKKIEDLTDSVVIIAGDPGIGKSTVLTTCFQKLDLSSWFIRVNLKDHQTHIENAKFEDLGGIIKFFSKSTVGLETALAKSLLRYRLKHQGQVVLLLDGYDEIKDRNQEGVIRLLQTLKDTKGKVWLTTRLNKQYEVENALGIFSYFLNPLDKEQQKEFLKQFWISKLNVKNSDQEKENRIDDFTEKLLGHFRGLGLMKEGDLVGIVLQARMVAEIFQDECRKYLKSEKFNPSEFRINNIFDLYERFIEHQYDRYFTEKIKIGKELLGKGSQIVLTESYTKAHGCLALKTLFSEDQTCKEFLRDQTHQVFLQDELSGMGLIKNFKDTDIVDFVHRTYAEYFMAKLLVSMLGKREDDPEYKLIREFLLRNIFLNRNKLIRVFFEHGIQKKCDNDDLNNKWKAIQDCDLLREMETKGSSQLFNLPPDSAISEKSLSELKEDVESCMNWQDSHCYRSGYFYNGDEKLINKLFQKFLKETDIEELETTLEFLVKANGKSYYGLANDEFSRNNNIYNAVKHYSAQAKLQNKLNRKFMKDMLSSVIGDTKTFEQKLAKLDSSTQENKKEKYAEELINFLSPWSQGRLNLLLIEFPFVAEIKQNIEKLYSSEGYYWLERDGIEFAKRFEILTPKMSRQFCSVLDEPIGYGRITGFDTGYASNILHGLIYPIIDMMKEEQLPDVHKLAFIKMLARFTHFSIEQKMSLSFKSSQLETVLKLIDTLLSEQVSVHVLESANYLFILGEAGLKLIDTGQELLILDPASEFQYALSSSRDQIVELIDWKCKNPQDNFIKAYGEVMIKPQVRKRSASFDESDLQALTKKRQVINHSIQKCKRQQKAYLHLSQFIDNHLPNVGMKSIRQGLYLPSFEERGVKIDGKCVTITRGLSQALLSQGDRSFLNNLETSSEIYERIVQGKQISKREEREVFTFSKLLDGFEQQLDSLTNSLPSNLINTKSYKTFGDLSNYIARIKGDFAIHLVINNHVVAIYKVGGNYAYFDSNAAFVSGLKNVDQLMQVVEKGIQSAGYKIEEKGLLVEHFDVERANDLLSSEDKQILAKEIKTERQLLAEQDKKLGPIKINGQELSRVQLYDFGTKINVEGGVPLLINVDMNLSSKKFQDHLDKKEVSMTAREYLDHLKDNKNREEVIQATRSVPFEGSKREIEEAEQTRKLKGSSLEQLVKGTINSILAAVSLTSASQSESQLPGKIDNKPETYLNDPIVDKQLQRLPGH